MWWKWVLGVIQGWSAKGQDGKYLYVRLQFVQETHFGVRNYEDVACRG